MTDASVETQLQGACPDWCEREHHPTDHPDDHVHYGPSVELSVRRRSRTMGENEEDWKSDASVMSIALAQRDREQAVWVLADLGVLQTKR
ncbi:DUF6907 domain-containing protein [Rathayibacter sp. Leaf248]|uniref:DUF6907 domain-containing protein n=1 Tax=Rathayibacter sp. Leaf248 TaxID=2876555 RepID=UPI001E327A82|nr:hypothetical protein [Rathayibacter sp. Leaf248]